MVKTQLVIRSSGLQGWLPTGSPNIMLVLRNGATNASSNYHCHLFPEIKSFQGIHVRKRFEQAIAVGNFGPFLLFGTNCER